MLRSACRRRESRRALEPQFECDLARAYSFAGERCDRIVAGVLARIDPPRDA